MPQQTVSGGSFPLRSILKYSITLLIAVVFLWFTFRDIDFHVILASLGQISYGYVFIAMALSLISHLTRALRWRILCSALSDRVHLGAAFAALMIGYSANLALGRGGELVRVYSLHREEDVPIAGVLATVVVERILDVLALAILLGYSIVLFAEPLEHMLPGIQWIGLLMLTGCVLLLVALIVASKYREPVLVRFESLFQRISEKAATPATRMLDTFLVGISSLHTPRQILGVVFYSLATWGLYIVVLYLMLEAFGFTVSPGIGLNGTVLLLVMTGIGVMVPTPGAFGTYHFFCMQTLVVVFAMPEGDAAAFATVTHAFQFLGVNGLTGILCWGLQQGGYLKGSARRG